MAGHAYAHALTNAVKGFAGLLVSWIIFAILRRTTRGYVHWNNYLAHWSQRTIGYWNAQTTAVKARAFSFKGVSFGLSTVMQVE